MALYIRTGILASSDSLRTAGRKLMACLTNHGKHQSVTRLTSLEYLVPYTTRLAMPDAMTLRLDFTGHDRVLGVHGCRSCMPAAHAATCWLHLHASCSP